MTQSNYPPPGMPPMQPGQNAGYQPMYPQQSNGFAIASLICSILGFCAVFVGGLLGIIFGILGIKKANQPNTGGKGMAIAGVVIGIITLLTSAVFVAMVSSSYFLFSKIASPARATIVVNQYLMDLSRGDTTTAASCTKDIPQEDLDAQSKTLKELGEFQGFQFSNFTQSGNDITVTGTIRLTNGTKSGTFTLTRVGSTVKITKATYR